MAEQENTAAAQPVQEGAPEEPQAAPAAPREDGAEAAAQLAAAEEQAARLEGQLAQAKDQLLRTAAEYDNYRKRSQKEKDAAFGDGLAHAVQQLLPVLDTLEMAAGAQTADENYKKGVEMTLQKAREAFGKLDVAEIEALGKAFDPNLMNAVLQQPAPEGTEAGVVLQVLQKGYTHAGKVVRHAAVAVSQ